ncbi:MAG: hypothetical protein FWG15_05315 [Propionibacteriaceae bacterium]|nr:hypothetical protein [Propionibacteriaceae bacterium]
MDTEVSPDGDVGVDWVAAGLVSLVDDDESLAGVSFCPPSGFVLAGGEEVRLAVDDFLESVA